MTRPATPTRPPSARSTSPARPATGRARVTLEWAKQAKPPYPPQGDKGLVVLRSRWNEAWKFPAADAKTRAARPARRGCGRDEHLRGVPRAPLDDRRKRARPARRSRTRIAWRCSRRRTTTPTGSSARRSTSGARSCRRRCTSAASPAWTATMPHTLKLRAEGNALCTRCHNAAAFDTEKHHFHKPGTKGAQCVECHMPAQNYMVVDARRDHGIRVAAPGPVALARQPECLHPVPRRPQAGVGGGGDGPVVRQDLARSPALRHDAARRRDAGREGAARAARAGGATRWRRPS